MSAITLDSGLDDALIEQSLVVYNAVHPREAMGSAGVRSYAEACRAFAVFTAYADGELAGAAHAAIEGDNPGEARMQVYVLPNLRRLGVGSTLLRALSSWAREHGAAGLRTGVDEDDADSLAWVARRGFREFSRESVLELDLRRTDPPAPDAPAGVEIVTWAERPELAEGLYDVACEAWLDIPGNDADRIEPFEEWLHVHMSGDGDLPEATFVAVAGDEVVGYAKFSIPSAQPGVAWHDLTGVKRAWRGRGIARALKSTQIAWAKREGYELLRTHNEERNAPIQRLNAHFGYRPAAARIRLRGPLVDG